MNVFHVFGEMFYFCIPLDPYPRDHKELPVSALLSSSISPAEESIIKIHLCLLEDNEEHQLALIFVHNFKYPVKHKTFLPKDSTVLDLERSTYLLYGSMR